MMKPTRRQVVGSLAAAATTRLFPRTARAAEPPPKTVRIAGGATFREGKAQFTGTSNLIVEQGDLERELSRRGVGIEWVPTSHAAVGPMINEAFANGRVDFASYGDLPATILNAGGVETRIVMANGVGGTDSFLVVPAGSPARRIEDLKGQRLAIHRGRPWELPLLRLLESRGLSYADFKLFNINPQAGAAALASGHVDALFTITDALLLEDKGVGRVIWSTKDAPLDWKMRTDLFAARTFLDQHPDIAQVVVTAHVKAAYWASQEQNREPMIKIAANNGTPENVIRRLYDRDGVAWKDRWSPLLGPTLTEHYRKTVDFSLAQKLIRRRFDVDSLFDRRFVPVALAALKLEGYWKEVGQPPVAAASK